MPSMKIKTGKGKKRDASDMKKGMKGKGGKGKY